MNVNKATVALFITRVLAVLLLSAALPVVAQAQTATTTNGQPMGAQNVEQGTPGDPNPGTAWDIRKNYMLRFPVAQEAGPTQVGGQDKIGAQGTAQAGQSLGPGTVTQGISQYSSSPLYIWPVTIPSTTSNVPTFRDQSIMQDQLQTFGLPISDTQMQLIQRYNQNRMLEEAFDPERFMWTSATTAGMQATSAANSAANMTVNQSQSAIDFTEKYLTNFTAQAGNQWQKIRDQLFIPMAILLLLPGAVAAQAKAIVSQGSPVLGDTNPFEGIIRSIVAVFLIPGTFLVINYGIDVSNSITFTISDEYTRIFGTNMYQDANCGMERAFPVNPAQNNLNAMNQSETNPTQTGDTAWNYYEALTFNLRQYDPCAGLDQTITPDEAVRDAKKIGRLATNMGNVGLTGMWNVLCAFQMAFLYYLWCMGPIAAALWVWPIAKLRQALPSWIEGVITLCFWSLFWNTTVLLMACFRGVGDTGTVIMSALTFLANICVKYAFDFSSLVSQGASAGVAQGIQSAMQGATAAAGGQTPGGTSGAAGTPGGTTGAAGSSTATSPAVSAGGLSPQNLSAFNSALSSANSQMGHSGLLGGSTGVPSSSGMPPGSTVTPASLTSAISAGGGGGGGATDLGLPPSAHPASLPGASGVPLSGTGAPGALAAFGGGGGGGGSSFSPSATTTAFEGGSSAFNSGAFSSLTNQGMGLHLNPDGTLQLSQNALTNLSSNNPLDPNSQAHSQLSSALQAFQNGDPSQLQAMATSAQGEFNSLSPQAQSSLTNMFEHGASLSPQDTSALTSFANGQGGVSIGPDGTVLNSATGAPIHLGGLGEMPSGGVNFGAVDPNTGMPIAGNMPPLSETGGLYKPGTDELLSSVTGAPNFSTLTGEGGAPTGLGMEPPPTNGLQGLAGNEGASSLSFVDANGQVLPPNAFDASGNPASGFNPTSEVYALNAQNGEAIAGYNPQTHEWSAAGTNGQVSLDPQSGQWTAGSGNAPVTYDNGQWYAQGTNGNISYDTSTGQMQAAGSGAPVTYDGGTYYGAGTNENVAYNSSTNQFDASVQGSSVPVSYDNGQWSASGTNGNITYDSSTQQLQAGDSGVGVTYDNGNYYAAGTNDSVYYNQNTNQFDASAQGSSVPVSYNSDNNQWYASGTNDNVYYNQGANQFEANVQGQAMPVNYDSSSSQFYASGTNNNISYDAQTQQFDVAGSNMPVNYDSSSNTYSTAGGQIYYDQSSNSFETAGSNAPVSYDSGTGQWYGAGTGNQVEYNQSTNSFDVAGTNTPVTYDSSSQTYTADQGQVFYDNQNQTFEASNSGAPVTPDSGGNWYASGSNNTLALDSSSGNFVAQGSGAPITYDQSTGGYYAAGTNDSVSYNLQSGGLEGPGGAPITYDQGSQSYYAAGTNGNVFYDSSQGQWEAQGAQGAVAYNYDSQTNQWTPQTDASSYSAYSSYAGDSSSYPNYSVDTSSYQNNPSYSTEAANYSAYQGDPSSYPNYSSYNTEGTTYSGYNQDGSTYPTYPTYSNEQPTYPTYMSDAGPTLTAYNADYTGAGSLGPDPGAGSPYAQPGDPGATIFGSSGSGVGDWGASSMPDPNAAPSGEYMREAAGDIYQSTHEMGGGSTEYHYDQGSEPTLHGPHATPEQYMPHPSESAQPQPSAPVHRPAPPPPPPHGSLGAIIPAWNARRPQSQPHAPTTHAKSSAPQQPAPPEAPQHKSGALEMGNLQGGLKSDEKKRKEQQELLREAWAEYKDDHPNDEEKTT